MEERFETITPDTIATATIDEIQQCGLSMRKAGYISGIADEVVSGNLDLARPSISFR